jgi:hypothetical protein
MSLPSFEEITGFSNRVRSCLPALIRGLQNHNIDDPVYSAVIEKSLGLTGPEVRAAVSYLRTRGIPIGSSSDGYFWARNCSELQRTVDHIEARIMRLQNVRNGLQRARFELTTAQAVIDFIDREEAIRLWIDQTQFGLGFGIL